LVAAAATVEPFFFFFFADADAVAATAASVATVVVSIDPLDCSLRGVATADFWEAFPSPEFEVDAAVVTALLEEGAMTRLASTAERNDSSRSICVSLISLNRPGLLTCVHHLQRRMIGFRW
jgi:hypothetical protein